MPQPRASLSEEHFAHLSTENSHFAVIIAAL